MNDVIGVLYPGTYNWVYAHLVDRLGWKSTDNMIEAAQRQRFATEAAEYIVCKNAVSDLENGYIKTEEAFESYMKYNETDKN